MTSIAADENYRCPEPIMLIVGGAPLSEWRFRTFVVPKGATHIELFSDGIDPGVQSD
jgi:hypothetical protein